MRRLLTVGMVVTVAAVMPIASASAAKACQAVEFEGHTVKVGVIGIDCPGGRERVELFYDRWNPIIGPSLVIEGFRCTGASAGADVRCKSEDRWIYATTRPYVDVTELNPKPLAVFRKCGSSSGSFKIGPGIPPLKAEVRRIVTRNVGCRWAKRFAHRLFFGQECIYCDAPNSYHPGDRVRFRGFLCRVTKGEPHTFHCRRGGKRINFKTATHF
ncbi:MAG: hypothetical protein WD827_05115 [Solirubrobacterales bacterium]